jgi:hypothetical protein
MALTGSNTQATQETVLQLLVNTAVAGNLDFTLGGELFEASKTPLNADVALQKAAAAKLNVKVAGILNLNQTGTFVNTDKSVYKGDLLKFFVGTEATTNVGGVATAGVNFIDIGPAPFATGPTYAYTPAEMVSKQFMLMQHLYQIFSALLGCDMGYQTYEGNPGMWTKHRFMGLTNEQNMYFITQVGAAAKSYGVTDADVAVVANALITIFNRKDAAALAIKAKAGLTTALQSMCQGSTCTESNVPTPQAYADAAGGPSPSPTMMPTVRYIYLYSYNRMHACIFISIRIC